MASWANAMFGDVLVGRDGTEHDTSTALAGKTVGIYFSAHWCPPCRQFTPAFARAYEKLTGEMGKNFEVIFVSSDRDENAFDEYRDEMPWLAMPFRDRELKAKLSKTFKVTGIPSLVVLDETGSVITTDGRRVALDVEKFPWTPPGVDEVLGDAFVRNDATKSAVTLRDIISTRDGEGSTHNNEDKDKATKGDKYVGIYFSAHWCGPCRQFTPKLKAAYESLRARGIDFEVIFVSSDRSEEEFTNYQSESMPDWLAVPFNDAERRAALAEHFKVTGIPRFAMLDGDLNVVNPDARAIAARDDETFSHFPWLPPLVVDVDSEEMDSGINDTPTLVVLMEECGEKWDSLNEALNKVARRRREKEQDAGLLRRQTLFATVTEMGGGVGGQLRRLAKLGRASKTPQMVLLDLANGGYVTHAEDAEVDENAMERLVDDFVAGKIELTEVK